MTLKLDVFDIARSQKTVEGVIALDEMPELAQTVLSLKGEGLSFRVTGIGEIEDLPAAELEIHGTAVMSCARCSEPVEVPVDSLLKFRFTKTEAEADAIPVEKDGEDVDVTVGSKSLSAADWVQEEALLTLPAMPLHENCVNRFGPKPEEKDEKSNPFAVLAALKKN
jgi:uncharacterized protein